MKTLYHRMKGFGFGILALVAVSALSACSNISRETGTEFKKAETSPMTVAVMPFENLTNHHNAGLFAAEITISELRGRNVFKDIAYLQDVRKAFDKIGIEESDRIRNTDAVRIGKLMGVDAVLIGSVTEYGYQYGLREEPSVTYSMRLVRPSDSKVLWTYSAGQVGRGVFSRESVSLVAFSVIADMVNAMSTGAPLTATLTTP